MINYVTTFNQTNNYQKKSWLKDHNTLDHNKLDFLDLRYMCNSIVYKNKNIKIPLPETLYFSTLVTIT